MEDATVKQAANRRHTLRLLALIALPCVASCGGGGGKGGDSVLVPTGLGQVQGYAYVGPQGKLLVSRSATPPTGEKPASGASVTPPGPGKAVKTDIHGHFLLAGIAAGSQTLQITASQTTTLNIPVTVFGDATVSLGPPAVAREAAIAAVDQLVEKDQPLDTVIVIAPQDPLPANVTVYPAMADPTGKVNQALVSRYGTE